MIIKLIDTIRENPGLPVKFFVGTQKEEEVPHGYSECDLERVEILDIAVYNNEYYTKEELENKIYSDYTDTLGDALNIKTMNNIISRANFNTTIVVFLN